MPRILLFTQLAAGRRAPAIYLWLLLPVALFFIAINVVNVTSRTFINHGDPTIPMTGWYFFNGHPIYHDVEAAERYSVLYGPMTFVIFGGFLQLVGPGMLAAKGCGVLGAVAAVIVTALLLWKCSGPRAAAVGMLYLLLMLGLFREVPYARGEPYLLLCVALALMGATMLGRFGGAALFAISLGVAIGLKAHAPVYLLPIAGVLFKRHGLAWTIAATALALPIVIAPFALENISAANYLAWLRIAAKHGLAKQEFARTVLAAGILCTPLLAALFARRVIQRDTPSEPGPWHWLRHHAPVIGCVIGVIVTIVVASKPGASSHHLLPFGPVFAWLIADAIKRAADGADAAPEPLALVERPGAIIVLCDLAMIMFIVFAAYPMVSRNAPVMRQMLADRARNQMILAEINEIERRHPGRRLAIGYGSPDDAGLFNFRQVLVYRGHPNLIDHNAYMDMKFAGLPLPEATLRAIDSCEVEIWLLPRDSRPFEWWNLYAPYDELFPDALRAQFRARFEPREQTEHFDLWFCKSAA